MAVREPYVERIVAYHASHGKAEAGGIEADDGDVLVVLPSCPTSTICDPSRKLSGASVDRAA